MSPFVNLNPTERGFHQPVSIDVVIEGQFFVLRYDPLGKDPHSHSIPDGPFCDVAVGVATVIREPPDAAFLSRVDELQAASNRLALAIGDTTGETHLILLEHHEIEVFYPLLPILPHPFLHGRRTKDIPDVFINKRVPMHRGKSMSARGSRHKLTKARTWRDFQPRGARNPSFP